MMESDFTPRSCLSIDTANLSFLCTGGTDKVKSFFCSHQQMPLGHGSTQKPFPEVFLRSGHQGWLRQ